MKNEVHLKQGTRNIPENSYLVKINDKILLDITKSTYQAIQYFSDKQLCYLKGEIKPLGELRKNWETPIKIKKDLELFDL